MAHGVMGDNLDTPATIAKAAVQEKPIVQSQGLTEGSSEDSFNQFIPSNGQGIPMTVASGFQYFALVLSRPKHAHEFPLINLAPTVNIEHELIARQSAPASRGVLPSIRGQPACAASPGGIRICSPLLQSVVPAAQLEEATSWAEELERLM